VQLPGLYHLLREWVLDFPKKYHLLAFERLIKT